MGEHRKPPEGESLHDKDNREKSAAPTMDSEARSLPAGVPAEIGRYHLKRIVAAGGMGTVYEAVQEHPRRIVALKVMRAGIASRSTLRRFEYEAQILARLKHPGIAQIYEADTYMEGETAVPFFAMEYVAGAKALTEFAQDAGLSIRKRLELFAEVCDAVQHGHQKGIIHRDLKPDNILVDPDGNPKIIDFGVARATDSDQAVTTLQTEAGQLVGTLQYMSPEQVEGDPHDLDVRSDVYSLGVILYELLTGKLPYDAGGTTVPNALMIIKEHAISRPSSLVGALRGDVETIVLKALEIDRKRRYQSAQELKQDIDRFLRNEPISARPPSLYYQIRVFARRNKLVFGAATAVLLVSVTASIVSTAFAMRASRERRQAQAVSSFLTDMFNSANPFNPRQTSLLGMRESGGVYAAPQGKPLTVLDVLRHAAKTLNGRSSIDPAVEADLRATLGETMAMNGAPVEGEVQIRRALALREKLLGPTNPKTLEARSLIALVRYRTGDLSGALQVARSVYIQAQVTWGGTNPRTLRYAETLARLLRATGHVKEGLQLMRTTTKEAFDRRGKTDKVALLHSLDFAVELIHARHRKEGLAVIKEARKPIARTLGTDSEAYAQDSALYGFALQSLGKVKESIEYIRTAVRIYRRLYGDDHPRLIEPYRYLGNGLMQIHQVKQSLHYQKRALKLSEEFLGPNHPETNWIKNDLAMDLTDQGRLKEAEPLARQALAGQLQASGEGTPPVLQTRDTLACLLQRQHKLKEAEALFRKNVVGAQKAYSKGDWILGIYYRNFGKCLMEERKYGEAAKVLTAAYNVFNAHAATRPWAVTTCGELVSIFKAGGKPEQAAVWRKRLEAAKRPQPKASQ